MNWSDLGKTIAGYAPLLGSVIGGPAGGAIGAIVASTFGVTDKPEAILEAVKNDPEAAIKLRSIELDHKTDLERMAMDLAKAEIADKQNARKEHKHSNMPAVLSVTLTIFIIGIVSALFYTEPPTGAREVLFMLLGVVIKEWSNSLHYWYGTTRSSANKDIK